MSPQPKTARSSLVARLKRRGVLRVATSYAIIAWLSLQIGDVVLDPFDFGDAAMRVLLIVVAVGFPVALALAWFFEITPQGIEVDHGARGAPRPSVHGLRRYADIVIIGVLVMLVAFLLARQGGLIEEQPLEQVVAVLPFASLSADDDDAYFGEGLADTLIHKLGQLNELVVLASQSTFQFTGRDLDLGAVGAKLGATTIMTGSVQRAGGALRINARLVDVASGRQLWSDSYDRGVADVFAIQDEIATAVTTALQLVLAPEATQRLARPGTDSLSAYDAYLLGLNRLAKRTGESNIEAIGFFQQAIAADPDYALAYTGLVETYHLTAWWSGDYSWDKTRADARNAAEKALSLDPNLGEAWLANALVAWIDWQRKPEAAPEIQDIIADFEKAIGLSPNNAMALKYFAQFLNENRFDTDRAQQLLARASRLDPRSGIIKINLGEYALEGGDLDAAESWFRQSISTADPYFHLGVRKLVEMHNEFTGRLDEAARWSVSWHEAYPGERRFWRVAVESMLNLGDPAAAQDLYDRFQPALDDGSVYNMPRFDKLVTGLKIERVTGGPEGSRQLAQQLSREFWESWEEWPELQQFGMSSWGITALVLSDLAAGREDAALAQMLVAYPGSFEQLDTTDLDVITPPVLTAALYKRTGQAEKARALLSGYLEYLRSLEDGISPFSGWTRFTILAMLGETDAALDELETRVNAGYLHQWWALRTGAFDPDYAAVIADPRFEALYGQIIARVDAQREAYDAKPELPSGTIP